MSLVSRRQKQKSAKRIENIRLTAFFNNLTPLLRAHPAPMAWSSDGLRGEPEMLDALEQFVFLEYLLLSGLVLTVLRNNMLHFKVFCSFFFNRNLQIQFRGKTSDREVCII